MGDVEVTSTICKAQVQIFELGFHGVEPEPVCQRSVQVDRFRGYSQLFVARHTVKRPHVVQAVRQFDQDHAYIFTEREKHLAEMLCLSRSAGFKYPPAFCETLINLAAMSSKHALNI